MEDKLDRIKYIITILKRNGIIKSQKQLGALMGYTNECSVSQILNGKTPIPKDFTSKLYGIAPEVNPIYVETGIGNALKESSSINISNSYNAGDIISNNEGNVKCVNNSEEKDVTIAQLTLENKILKERVTQLEAEKERLYRKLGI